jgi:hypothetical protein
VRRREFVTLVGGAAAWPMAARAEQPTKMSVIACLVGGSKTAAERYFGGFALAAEMVPGVNRIGLLVNPDNPSHPLLRPGLEVAAKTLGIELISPLSKLSWRTIARQCTKTRLTPGPVEEQSILR